MSDHTDTDSECGQTFEKLSGEYRLEGKILKDSSSICFVCSKPASSSVIYDTNNVITKWLCCECHQFLPHWWIHRDEEFIHKHLTRDQIKRMNVISQERDEQMKAFLYGP